ncbi:MAG: hypothetical protein LBH56_02625 [Coriobacteriales bacterium]|nr:hypothetical protein [Coriobacteriales bacterium]
MSALSTAIEEQLAPFTAHITGNPLASLIAVKGLPGPFEQEGKSPFSGQDGLALDRAFGRLGWGYGSRDTRTWLGVLLELPSALPAQTQAATPAQLSGAGLRLICEIVDPLTIIALDNKAHGALIDAFGAEAEKLAEQFIFGGETRVLGRQLVSVTGFEDALGEEQAKQRVWAQLKRCAR